MEPWEERANAAQVVADKAASLLEQHIDDCARRYEALQRSISDQFRLLGEAASTRHQENQRRLDAAEENARQLFFLIMSGGAAAIIAMATLIVTLAINGHIGV